MTALTFDLAGAVRALVSARAFTALAIGTLTFGLALSISVLTVINAYLLRSIPYPAADRLVRIDYARPGQMPPRGLETLDWTPLDDIIEFRVAWDLDMFYLLGQEYPESAPGAWVTPGFMGALGIEVVRGRVFEPADFAAGAATVALISDRLWRGRFQSAPDIVGRQFRAYVSDRPAEAEVFTIVGVLPAGLWHFNPYTEIMVPLRAATYPYMARLREGVPAALAAERIDGFVRGGLTTVPGTLGVAVRSVHDAYVEPIRPVLWTVAAASGLVMLIAGLNVAVLMLVRGHTRERELAVRLALGATQMRLARALMAEAFIIGTVATVSAVVLSQVLMMRLGPSLERVLERRVPGGPVMLALDVNLVLIASACGLAVTMLCAAAPLLATWRASLATSLARGGRAATDSRGAHRWRALLIGAEVAASLTLLVGAVLMIQTSFVLLRVDFGIRADAVTTASLALPPRTYPDPGSRAAFFARLEHELAGVPGVTSFALGDWWPLQGSQPRRVRAGDERAGSEAAANVFGVSSTYFATLRMTLRDGRVFETADRQGGEPVAIVSASLARRLWPATRAVGQTVRIDGSDETPLVSARVVGVVNDVRQSHTDVEHLDLYLPQAQRATRFAFIYVTGPPLQSVERDLRLALARLDANVALGAPRGLQEGIDSERARPMFIASLLAVFAVLAAMLALVGMHGVIAYAVRQRRREVAVRLAIGARPHMVTALFVRQGVIVLASGIAAGLVGALALGRGLQSQLHGVRAAEPHTLVLTATAFALCGLAAIWWPAWRAAATDPALVLKED